LKIVQHNNLKQMWRIEFNGQLLASIQYLFLNIEVEESTQ